MNCAEYAQWFSPYLDEQLSADERQRLEEHMNGCGRCRTELASLQLMVSSLRSAEPVTVPALLPGIHQQILHESWWRALARRFVAPWPMSLPWHSLALATAALFVMVVMTHPGITRPDKAMLQYPRTSSLPGQDGSESSMDGGHGRRFVLNQKEILINAHRQVGSGVGGGRLGAVRLEGAGQIASTSTAPSEEPMPKRNGSDVAMRSRSVAAGVESSDPRVPAASAPAQELANRFLDAGSNASTSSSDLNGADEADRSDVKKTSTTFREQPTSTEIAAARDMRVAALSESAFVSDSVELQKKEDAAKSFDRFGDGKESSTSQAKASTLQKVHDEAMLGGKAQNQSAGNRLNASEPPPTPEKTFQLASADDEHNAAKVSTPASAAAAPKPSTQEEPQAEQDKGAPDSAEGFARAALAAKAPQPVTQQLIQLQWSVTDVTKAVSDVTAWVGANSGFAVATNDHHLSIKLPASEVNHFLKQFSLNASGTDADSHVALSSGASSIPQWITISLELAPTAQ